MRSSAGIQFYIQAYTIQADSIGAAVTMLHISPIVSKTCQSGPCLNEPRLVLLGHLLVQRCIGSIGSRLLFRLHSSICRLLRRGNHGSCRGCRGRCLSFRWSALRRCRRCRRRRFHIWGLNCWSACAEGMDEPVCLRKAGNRAYKGLCECLTHTHTHRGYTQERRPHAA